MVHKAAEASQCEVATEGVVLWDEALVKTSPEDPQMRCKELRCYNDSPVMCLKKDVNCELENDGLLPKLEAEVSSCAHQDSVPSSSGFNLAVSLDGMAGEFGNKISEHRTGMERVACGSQGGGMLSCERGFWKEPIGVENQFPRMEGCHENGGLPDLGKLGTEKFPQGADGLSLIDANHELERDCFLANIDEEVSFPVDEASAPSFYQSPMNVIVEDSKSCIEKLTQDSLEGDMLSCEREARFRTEASGNENQHHRMAVSKGQISSVCKDANNASLNACGLFPEIEVPLQQADKKYKVFELPPEIYLARSSYDPPCLDGLCRSGKESSAVCLGHQDSSGIKSCRPDHLVQELNAYNSFVDKPCSADFVENGNYEESQNHISESLNASKRRNPRRAASSRNRTLVEHDQMNKGSSSTCKSKKVESSCSLVESTMIKFPNKTTKVRSGIIRPPKLTAWGSLEKLTDGFGQNCEPSTSNSHLICPENSGRSKRGSGKKEQPIVRKARSSRCSKYKFPAFSVTRYAPDELNSEPTFSVMDGTYGYSEGYIGNFPRLAPHALLNVSDDAHKTAQHMSIQTDMHQLDRCLESVTQETCPAYIRGEFAKSISQPSLNNAGVGFSPDSVLEVASVTCENNTSASHDVKLRGNPSYPAALTESDLHASDLSTSDFGKNHASSSTDFEQQPKTARGDENTKSEKINQSHAIIGYVGEGKVQGLQKSNAVTRTKMLEKQKGQKKDGIKGNNIRDGSSTKISSSEASKYMTFSDDPSSLVSSGPLKFSSCFEVVTSATQGISMHEHGWVQGPSVIGKEKTSAHDNVKSPRCKKSGGLRGKKDMVRDPHVKQKSKKKNIADDILIDSGLSILPYQLATDLAASHTNEQGYYRSPAIEFTLQNPAAISTELPGNAACSTGGASVPQPKRAAWACCDDCQKWRCIPSELADVIGENRWTCKDNDDRAFADCSIPQAKTNAEINAELELSDASADEADKDGSNSKASRAPSWTNLRSNTYLHRNRRNQSIDESMVCNCKPPQDGRMGCRDGCLNRMLNIECAKRTCPCEEQCSNQQFQRRNYAKIAWFHSGKKGYGLQLLEEVSEGRFLIEYVGEVLDITTYESRQRDYASKGKKHFYFMALDGGEVIDACTKGNLGRFINHSCSPNCRTEKWMVNGEVCIGIFAMRNIKKGEELTFDYNYVRVSGAAPQKCFCGTAKCRGYIGGDISESGIITQHDAVAEHFEPMVTYKDAEEMLGNACSHGANTSIVELEHETSIQQEDSNNCPPVTPDSEPHQNSLILFDNSELENSWEVWSPEDAEDPTRTPVHVSRIDSTLQQLPVYDTQPLQFLPKAPNTMDGSKDPDVMNRSARSSDLGHSLVVPGFHAKKKNNLKDHRDVKSSLCSIDNENTLGVEARLNNLLDRDGGISRRNDSANEYLKLLVFVIPAAHDNTTAERENAATPAECDNAGGTSKSARDLSLILDALLKTKSRSVLLDIIHMNGLQMLHNILKQNRDTFLRRPIIRKLLKVLEFLALKGILRAEKINEKAPREKMERFRDSMLKLTWHSDKQVQTIARQFCENWIHPYMDGPFSTSKWHTDSYSTRRRKRKSRWDYRPESHYKTVGLQVRKVYGELGLQADLIRNRSQPMIGSSSTGAEDDVPPGFEPQQGRSVAPGFCHPNLSISYGIPISLVQHLGTPEVEGGGNRVQKWKVAPGVPFIPFPQLQRGSPCPSTSTQMSCHDAMRQNSISGYRGRGFDRGGRVQRNGRNGARTRYPYDHQGRRFPSNHHRSERWQPWPQEHDGGSGSRGRQ